MVIFHSYVSLAEGTQLWTIRRSAMARFHSYHGPNQASSAGASVMDALSAEVFSFFFGRFQDDFYIFFGFKSWPPEFVDGFLLMKNPEKKTRVWMVYT